MSEGTKSSHTGFPCSACGAQLAFTPGKDHLTCPYCGHEQVVETPQTSEDPESQESTTTTSEIKEYDYLEALLNPITQSVNEISANAKEVECSNCGAITMLNGQAGSCPFCDSPMVIKESTEGIIVPESLLPFKIDQEKAQQTFRDWIKSRWFAPNDLVARAKEESIDGVYLPYWTYDSNTRTEYRGERGEYYYVNESYTDSDGKRRTRRVRKTRWYNAEGSVSKYFDDVMVCASKSLPQTLFDGLEPWPTEDLKPYTEGFLAGFSAERYSIPLKDGFSIAEQKMDVQIRKAIKRDIGGDDQRVHRVDTNHNDIKFKLILLPLWISSFRYNDKVFRFLVNAQTGEANGERPYSVIKIALLVIAILGFLLLMVFMQR